MGHMRQRKAATYGKFSRRFRPDEDRIRLEGLVERPVVTKEEFEWMQQRLMDNKQLAQKNTKLRSYRLKGMIRCAACGKAYVGVTLKRNGKEYSYYVCGARWERPPRGERCRSHSLSVDTIEAAAVRIVVGFLHGPEGFEAEMQRRRGISAESEVSLTREIESLGRQHQEEQETEARAFRLRGTVSEQAFNQEIGLIQTRQRWIAEQKERVEQQLADILRYSFDSQSVRMLRQRVAPRLGTTKLEDRRFILEAVGTKVIVQADGTWELELQLGREAPAPEDNLQIVNSRPGSNRPATNLAKVPPGSGWVNHLVEKSDLDLVSKPLKRGVFLFKQHRCLPVHGLRKKRPGSNNWSVNF